jgi:hypothetical protein
MTVRFQEIGEKATCMWGERGRKEMVRRKGRYLECAEGQER